MQKAQTGPSEAWLAEIFQSPPRRNIRKLSKTTTRVPVDVPLLGTVMYAEGGHEATGLLLCKHLHQHGLVRRFKAQAFELGEIDGPRGRVPDLLIELDSEPSLHVVQCKAKRFVSPEVLEKYLEEQLFLEMRGFKFHSWTDRDKLSSPTSQSVRLLDRGFQNPMTHGRIAEIQTHARQSTVLNELLDLFGWDEVMAAAAHGAFFLNVTEKIHENSPILNHFPRQRYECLFSGRPVPRSFWDTLAP
jgi:hypothetical protein